MLTALSRKAAEAKLLGKAAQDAQFRAQLVADPRAAIEREFGVRLPEEAKVSVLEEKPDEFYLVLPLNPEYSELKVAELDAVSAGSCYLDSTCPDTPGCVYEGA